MGDYTKVQFDAQIIKDASCLEFFKKFDRDTVCHSLTPGHDFFTTPRWHMLLRGCSEYYPTSGFRFWPQDVEYDGSRASVHINSSFKAYGDEIEYFLHWAESWATREYVFGYVLSPYHPPKWITTDYDLDSRPIILRGSL